MTYNEINELIYPGDEADYPSGKAGSLSDIPAEDQLAWMVIELFRGRKDFQPWWHNIRPDIQDEIFDGLRRLLKGEI